MWAQIVNTVLGLWLMMAPAVIGYSGKAADNSHIAGPIIVTFSVVAIWECTRALRKWNYPVAIWLLFSFLILDYENTTAIFNDMIVGVLVIFFSSIKGKIKERYGGGWTILWKSDKGEKMTG